jgi:hypothetical protein
MAEDSIAVPSIECPENQNDEAALQLTPPDDYGNWFLMCRFILGPLVVLIERFRKAVFFLILRSQIKLNTELENTFV